MIETAWKEFATQRNQLALMWNKAAQHDRSGLSKPSAPKAQAFGESLLLCPSQEAAQAHTQRDLEGARAFLMVADKVVFLSEREYIEFSNEWIKGKTPFFLLASIVLENLEKSKSIQPDLWK